MSYSLNETEALCRKATRGAGFGWGEAEAAGRAARWLEMQGLPGASALAQALECLGARPVVQGQTIGSDHGPLCAIKAGIALADHSHLLARAPVTLGAVNVPLLLLGFVSVASHMTSRSVMIEGSQVKALILLDDLDFEGTFERTEGVKVSVVNALQDCRTRRTRAEMTAEVYARLDHFAQRTYAPATEASRIAGAGAGLSDND